MDREPSWSEGFLVTLWVSGEEWVVFSSSSAHGAPTKIHPYGEVTFFWFPERPHLCRHGPWVDARHHLPVLEVSEFYWETGSVTHSIFYFFPKFLPMLDFHFLPFFVCVCVWLVLQFYCQQPGNPAPKSSLQYRTWAECPSGYFQLSLHLLWAFGSLPWAPPAALLSPSQRESFSLPSMVSRVPTSPQSGVPAWSPSPPFDGHAMGHLSTLSGNYF